MDLRDLEIGTLPELSTTWARQWRALSRRPFGEAWVYLAQSLAAAAAGDTGRSRRAEASGVHLNEAALLEADWSAAHNVRWLEDAAPTWPAEEPLQDLLVPLPPTPWSAWRDRWRVAHPGHRCTAPWAILQWALRSVPPRHPVGVQVQMRVLEDTLGWRRNTLAPALQRLEAAGLLHLRALGGRASALAWPASRENAPNREAPHAPRPPRFLESTEVVGRRIVLPGGGAVVLGEGFTLVADLDPEGHPTYRVLEPPASGT